MLGTGSPNASDAVNNELHGSIGIMDIARSGQTSRTWAVWAMVAEQG